MRAKNWFGTDDLTIEDVIDTFYEWAPDAPAVFEMDALKSISNCLASKLRK